MSENGRTTKHDKPVDAGKLEQHGTIPTPEYVGNYRGDPAAAGELAPIEVEGMRREGRR